MKYLTALFLLLAGSAPEQQTEPAWTVVFYFRQDKPLQTADIRVYVSVRAHQEGEAAIKAHDAVCEKLALDSIKSLVYLEAQKREDGK